jgi:site-specific recombinase XerD
MATSVKLILRKDKAKPDGRCPVFLQIIANRKKRYLSSGVYVQPRDWHRDKQRVRGTHELSAQLNDKLRSLLLQAEEQALSSESAVEVKSALVGGRGSLTAYFEQFIRDLDMAGRFWDWKKYRVTLGKLRRCFGQDVDWKEIDRRALIRFEGHLREKEGNNPNTIRKELQRLRRVFRQAIKDGVPKVQDDPFVTYDRPKSRKPNRRKLSIDEIEALERLELPVGSNLRVARDAFMLSFYGGGVRFGDVCCLKKDSVRDGRLAYRMLKTGNAVSIPLPPQALELLQPYLSNGSDYLFPFLKNGDEADPVHLRRRISSNNTLVNMRLKEVARLAGIREEGLSMHVARHSYADLARTRSGDLYAISRTLGHSDLKTTEQYLKSLDQEAVDRLAESMWKT